MLAASPPISLRRSWVSRRNSDGLLCSLMCYLSIEILFGALGKIKKVKIYTTPLGQRKGDALVTYVSAEHATTASLKVSAAS
jgi:hypothetical protein